MPEPIEFYGVWASSLITGIHNNSLERRLGPPDAIMRRGCRDNLLYRCERVLDYATSRRLHSGPDNPPTLYTLREGARLVRVTEQVLRLRILPEYAAHPPALLMP